MSAFLSIADILTKVRELVKEVKVEDITINEARILIAEIHEAEGWLKSARILLDPEETL